MIKKIIFVNNNDNFLIIQLYYNSEYLHKVFSTNNYEIYKFDVNGFVKIYAELYKINTSYNIFSDIIIKKNKKINNTIINVLLVKSTVNIIKPCSEFKKIIKFGNGYLWKPVKYSTKKYINIGVIYDDSYPKINYCIINIDYVKKCKNLININNLITTNKYNMLMYSNDNQLNINFKKINSDNIKNNDISNLLVKKGKYVTLDKSNTPWFLDKDTNNNNNNKIHYEYIILTILLCGIILFFIFKKK